MKSFKLLFVSLFLSSLSANSELNLDLKEYEIEIIIFKHTNVLTDEKFDEEFATPLLKQYLFINQPYRLMKMPINQNQKIIFLIGCSRILIQ